MDDFLPDFNSFNYSHIIENDVNHTKISIDINHYQSLIKTIQNLTQQISSLQVTNAALSQSLSTISTNIHDNDFPQMMTKLNAITVTLNKMSSNCSTNKNQITSYFLPKPTNFIS